MGLHTDFVGCLGEMVVGTLRPRKPDERFIRSIVDAGLPSPTRTAKVRTLPQTPRLVPAFGVIEGARKRRRIEIAVTSFVVELQLESQHVRDWWPRHDVAAIGNGSKKLRQPRQGPIEYSHVVLQVADHPDQTLLTSSHA